MAKKHKMRPWHEDDKFWETMAPKMFPEKQFSKAASEVDSIVKLLKIKPKSKVLDLCCGPARHSLELARHGFQVTGVDRTRSYIDGAKKQAKREKLEVEFIHEDMRCFKRNQKYDAVLNLFTSFGYFKDKADDQQVVKNIYQSLKPGGKLLIEIMGKEVLLRIFQERDWKEENGAFFLEERKLSRGGNWIECRWILIEGNKPKEFTISHRLYSSKKLSELLLKSGFKEVKLFGDLSRAPYDQKAKRLVVLARK